MHESTECNRVEALRARIPEARLRFTFARSGGPGGQNVNKVASRVTLWFDLDNEPELSESQKARIRGKMGGRVNAHGQLFVVSMRHRTQAANRRAATERFYELLAGALDRPKPRKRTADPARTKRHRLDEKRKQGERKQLRGRVRRAD